MKDFAMQLTQKCVSMGLLDESYSEWFASSPSLFSMGTRERTGTTFQKVNCQTIYTIYVRKVDYERAVHVIIV